METRQYTVPGSFPTNDGVSERQSSYGNVISSTLSVIGHSAQPPVHKPSIANIFSYTAQDRDSDSQASRSQFLRNVSRAQQR